jgi:hypothetical protein
VNKDFQSVVGPWDDVDGYELSHPLGSRCAGIDRRAHCRDFARNLDRHESSVGAFAPDQADVSRLEGGVGRFNGSNETAGLDQS